MAGLTDQGLTILRLPDVITALKTEAGTLFKDLLTDPNDIVDTSDSTTLGRLIGLVSPSLSDLWEASQEVYSAFDPNSATGISLDNLVALAGITRIPESSTIADCYFEGSSNVIIPSPSVVRSSSTGMTYHTQSSIILDQNRTCGIGISVNTLDKNNTYTIHYRLSSTTTYLPITINTTANPTISDIYTSFTNEIAANHSSFTTYQKDGRLFIVPNVTFQLFDFFVSDNISITKVIKVGRVIGDSVGAIEQPVNTIDIISTPVLGWDSVINPAAATVGRLKETDEELRTRFRNTKFERATNIMESLYSALLSVNAVNNVIIYENDTDITNGYGVLPHSFLVLIDGGNDYDIAYAIWNNRPTGIRSQGTTSIDINDSQGFVRTINFERPSEVSVYIEIKLQTNSLFPQDGQDQIRTALINYINKLTINDDVVYSRLYTPINSVPGHQVDSLRIGLSSDTLGTSNIVTAFNEIPKTDMAKIVFI